MKQLQNSTSAVRRILAICLVITSIITMIPTVSAIHPNFFQNHSDWHFDLTKEPDRPMTVEEFIALSTAYSYWSVGTNNGVTPKDKDGNLPSDWAAPYIRSETQKGTIQPATLDYDAPATLAFAMEFFLHCKGKYSYDAVNFYRFTGTAGLTAEQLLCLNAAIDYGIFPYQENMDVSAKLLRRDLENKYLIPSQAVQIVKPTIMEREDYAFSMAFFSDCYWGGYDKSRAQLETLKAHIDDFNIVSLGAIYLQKRSTNQTSYVDCDIDHENPNEESEPQLELIDFCRNNNIKILGGVIASHDDSSLKLLVNNDAAIEDAVDELIAIVDDYKLDGLNLDIEVPDSTYRNTYSKLIKLLSERLHAKGKMLVATVGCYFTDAGQQTGIYDYACIRDAADLVMLMAYDDHSAHSYENANGTVGSVSTLIYIKRCIQYAKAVIGADKLLLGTASYGIKFNTTTHTAVNVSQKEVNELIAKHNATVKSSGPDVDDAYFTYTENGQSFAVYFESIDGLGRRLDLAKQYGLAGVANFHIGAENPQAFDLCGKDLAALPFRDIAKNQWYTAGVTFAYENGLMKGINYITFNPKGTLTRAELVTILYRVAGEPEVEYKAVFTDVPEGAWYTDAVVWAYENEVVKGVGDGTRFDPNGKITREQIATILYRYAGSPEVEGNLDVFPDKGVVRDYAKNAMIWATSNGIITGVGKNGANYLAPEDLATREQIATIMMRYLTAE